MTHLVAKRRWLDGSCASMEAEDGSRGSVSIQPPAFQPPRPQHASSRALSTNGSAISPQAAHTGVRNDKHEAILHADDWRLISNAYEIYLCKHVRLILWRCNNGGALSRRQSGLREASLPPFCGRGTEKGEKGKKERDSRNKIRARPLFDRCRSRLVIGTARG